MTKEEILHLSNLSRIKVTDEEAEIFKAEIDSILGYVSAVNEIVAEGDLTKQVGPVHNIFREDEVVDNIGATADELIEAFPEKQGRFLKVKKILNND